MRKLQNEELSRLSVPAFRNSEKTPVIIVLDHVRSHLNVGSIFRSGDAFLVEAIYLCGITGIPPHREIQKTALGATETVSWRYFQETSEAIELLKTEGVQIIVIEQAEQALSHEKFTPQKKQRYALVFGNEVDGVQQEIVYAADMVLEIPQWGTKHSLNVAVSAGIVLWECVRKIRFGA